MKYFRLIEGAGILKVGFAVISSMMILAGCASTIQVRVDEPLNNDRIFNYDQVNARTEYDLGTLVCTGEILFEVKGVHVARDSTLFFEVSSDIRRSVATKDVLSIRRKDHASGAFTGGLFGALAGLTAGVGVLLVHGRGSSEGGPGILVLLAGLFGGGAVMGTTIGAIEGSTQEFQFQTPGSPRRQIPDSTKSK